MIYVIALIKIKSNITGLRLLDKKSKAVRDYQLAEAIKFMQAYGCYNVAITQKGLKGTECSMSRLPELNMKLQVVKNNGLLILGEGSYNGITYYDICNTTGQILRVDKDILMHTIMEEKKSQLRQGIKDPIVIINGKIVETNDKIVISAIKGHFDTIDSTELEKQYGSIKANKHIDSTKHTDTTKKSSEISAQTKINEPTGILLVDSSKEKYDTTVECHKHYCKAKLGVNSSNILIANFPLSDSKFEVKCPKCGGYTFIKDDTLTVRVQLEICSRVKNSSKAESVKSEIKDILDNCSEIKRVEGAKRKSLGQPKQGSESINTKGVDNSKEKWAIVIKCSNPSCRVRLDINSRNIVILTWSNSNLAYAVMCTHCGDHTTIDGYRINEKVQGEICLRIKNSTDYDAGITDSNKKKIESVLKKYYNTIEKEKEAETERQSLEEQPTRNYSYKEERTRSNQEYKRETNWGTFKCGMSSDCFDYGSSLCPCSNRMT